jgi:hypothetical protein
VCFRRTTGPKRRSTTGKWTAEEVLLKWTFVYMCPVVDEQPVTRVCVLYSGRDIAQSGSTLQRKKLEENRYFISNESDMSL